MPTKQSTPWHPHALAIAALLAGLLVTWFAYSPGIGGSLHFDDRLNLQGLASVEDLDSASRYIFSGSAGPLGRPLALASFVPQAYAWPHAPDVLLRTNILIHLLNGALVTWFLYLLGRARRQTERQAALVAAGAATLWMLLPLLASSSLFIVQRMTTLSAMFMLAGAVAYLYARRATDHRPTLALIGMTLALGAGAALGILAKENGALLFLFVLAMEATLLDRPRNIPVRLWRGWFAIVLIAPLIVLSLYLAAALPYAERTLLIRDFNGVERLMTQAGVLWKYLYLAFIPNVPSLGPFHDNYPVQRNLMDLVTLLSVGGWMVVISAAVWLRRKAPLFSFAVAWFLLGHLLESTTLSLELYFEHRNYLPLVGPVYAMLAALVHLEQRWRRWAVTGVILYAGLLATVLFSVTSLWGSPVLAAEMWQIRNPGSLRATQNLSQSLTQRGRPDVALRVLEEFLEANPEVHEVRLQILLIRCQSEPDTDLGDAVLLSEEKLRSSRFSYSSVILLGHLYGLATRGACASIDGAAVYRLGQSLLDNPSFNTPMARHNIHDILARISIEERDFGRTMMHMEESLSSHFNLGTLTLAMAILNSGGRYELSRQLLDDALSREPPRHPVRAYYWKEDLAHLQTLANSKE